MLLLRFANSLMNFTRFSKFTIVSHATETPRNIVAIKKYNYTTWTTFQKQMLSAKHLKHYHYNDVKIMKLASM